MSIAELVEQLFESYGPDRMGRKYGYRDPDVYTLKGYHRGQDIRRQNAAKTASLVADVVSLSAGKVVFVGRPNSLLGLTIVVDTGRARGRYEIHSHLAGAVVAVGDRVAAGEKLARNAAAHERPGTAWGGPHDHFVISDYLDGSWMKRSEYDPAPFIRAALVNAAAAVKPKPAPAASKPKPVAKPKPKPAAKPKPKPKPKPRPKPKPKPKVLHLPSYYWYDHPNDAARHVDAHGKRRGESMLSGPYTVLETSSRGAFKVRSGANGIVWVSPLAKKYLR